MNFDLESAIAVREREDGLLEKDVFDLSSAVPVDNVVPTVQPLTTTPEKPNWILTTADKVGSGLKKMLTLPGQDENFVETMVKGLSHANDPVYTGRIRTGSWEEIPTDQIPYAQRSAGDQTKWEWQEAVPTWEAAIEQGVQVALLAYVGYEVGSTLVNTLKANQLARNVQKASVDFADEMVKVVGPQEYTKIKTSVGETSKQYLNARDFFMKGFQKEAISRLSALEETAGGFKTVAESEMKNISFMEALKGEIGTLNTSLGEAGQALTKRPNIGQTVVFEGGDKPLIGIVKSITEDLVTLDMGVGAEEIVATLSQLSLPEVKEVAQIKQETPQGEEILPKTEVSTAEPIIKNLKLSPEETANINKVAETISPELEKIKGKPLTHDEVVEAAQSSDILKQVIDRTQSKEVEAALLRTRQHLTALAEQKGISEDFIKTLKIVKSFGTDAARKLGSLRIEAEANEFNLKTKITNKLIENGVELDKIIKASEGLDFKNQEQVTDFYRQFVKPKLWDIVSEYRYINLLSSPRTHIVNAFSNLLQVSGLAPTTKLASGVIDKFYTTFKPGKERSHYVAEVPAYIKGAANAIGDAGSKALDALKGKSFVERPDVTHLPTGNKFLKTFRYIPQALEASDVFFRTIAEAGELEAQLAKGVELKEAQAIAKEKASYWVFRKALDPENKTGQGKLLSEIDKLTSMVYKLRSLPIAGKAISWFLPFVQTPMNIAKQMIEFSPFGGGTIPGSKDKIEQTAKSLIGTIITAIAGAIVASQESTWEMPTNKKEKELFIASGRIPFAIKLGNTWYSYNRLGPIGFPIAIAAAMKWYLSENPSAATDTKLQRASKVVGGLGAYFGNQSYVQGITDLMNFVKNAPGALPKLISGIPSQIIPLSAFQRWINTQIIDPVYRKSEKELSVEAIIDNARSSIIGLTKGMEAYKDINDEESKRSMPRVNALSPIPVSKAKDDSEYKDYLEKRKEDLIDKKESGDEPKRRSRRRR